MVAVLLYLQAPPVAAPSLSTAAAADGPPAGCSCTVCILLCDRVCSTVK
jgi:hypothetical protein